MGRVLIDTLVGLLVISAITVVGTCVVLLFQTFAAFVAPGLAAAEVFVLLLVIIFVIFIAYMLGAALRGGLDG